eukprot:GHVL01045005.1.p1 GENE.GHVL01045005.1~~GHVL01045005.1.p1  ORF type:complete len:775 (+),score=145.17 GHVL01045005.1:43-2367(+)
MADQDQEKLLDEASSVVREHTFHMKKAIDNNNLRESLKHASTMLCELRTSLLSPHSYYELYMQVFQELQHLYAFFSDTTRHGKRMADLYESVQHAGNVLPRLYLLISVGASYIKNQQSVAKDILENMTELAKGVQHPMRGLFLRYYLNQMCKDKLSESDSNIMDSFTCVFTNFVESGRLWIRMQHQGPVKDKIRREKDRHELRVLVGAHLVRLSQLEGMTSEFYASEAFPKIIENIVNCKDTMAQQYLLDCIIQVFSDECHVITLEMFLESCTKVQSTVDLKPIMINLMNRLSNFISNNPDCVKNIDVFTLFNKNLQELFNISKNKENEEVDLSSFLELQVSFLKFSMSIYSDRLDYVDAILASTACIISSHCKNGGTISLNSKAISSIVELLSTPLKSLSKVLSLNSYTEIIKYINYSTHKQVSIYMVNEILNNNIILSDLQSVETFFIIISALLKDENKYDNDEELSKEFIQDQEQIAKLLYNIKNDDPCELFHIYEKVRSCLIVGGNKYIKYTYPTLITCSLQLIPKVVEMTEKTITIKKMLQFIHKMCTSLTSSSPDISFRLFLQAATIANQCDPTLESICFEFMSQALITYEEEFNDTRRQFAAIIHMVGVLIKNIDCLIDENYENIAAKLTQHGAKLLRKPDQCRAILACSHLFWDCAEVYRDPRRVVECLQKCLKISDAAIQSNPANMILVVEILEKYMYFYEKKNPVITVQYIANLVSLCREHLDFAENSPEPIEAEGMRRSFDLALTHMRTHKQFEELDLNKIES